MPHIGVLQGARPAARWAGPRAKRAGLPPVWAGPPGSGRGHTRGPHVGVSGGLLPSVLWVPVVRWHLGVRGGRVGRGILERLQCPGHPAGTQRPSGGARHGPMAPPWPPARLHGSQHSHTPPSIPTSLIILPCPPASHSDPRIPHTLHSPQHPPPPQQHLQRPQHLHRTPQHPPTLPPSILMTPSIPHVTHQLHPKGSGTPPPFPPWSILTAEPLAPGMPSVPGLP